MNVDTGGIKKMEDLDTSAERMDFIKMKERPTVKQLRRTPASVGRNEPCPCGSGLKFKKCHLRIP